MGRAGWVCPCHLSLPADVHTGEYRRLSADESVQFFLHVSPVFFVFRLEDCGLTAEKKYNRPLLVLSMQTISNWRVFVFVQANCELKQVNLHIVWGGEGRRAYLELVDAPPCGRICTEFSLNCEPISQLWYAWQLICWCHAICIASNCLLHEEIKFSFRKSKSLYV